MSRLSVNWCCTALVTSMVACGGSPSTPAPATDTTPPTVLASSPAASASQVAVTAVISIAFSEPVAPTSLAGGGLVLRDGASNLVPGVVLVTGSGATFTPATPLLHATTYTATVTTAASDLAGNHLAADHAWSFTTVAPPDTTPPTVLATAPADGASGVPANTAVAVTFSEPVALASVAGAFSLAAAGGANVAGAVQVSGATATFTPASPLANGSAFTATVAATAADLAGNPLGAAVSWSFTTGAAPDTTPPWITGSAPVGGSIGQPVKLTVWVTFSEPMNPVATASAMRLVGPGGLAVPATVAVVGDTATLTPDALLGYEATYTAHLTSAAADLAGNHFGADDLSWSFTTKARDPFDDAFGAGGFAVVRAGRSAGASAVVLQPDGAVVVAGGTIDPLLGSLDVLLARFTPAGSLDTTFGVRGLARWDGGAVAASNPAFRNDGASSVAVQADGRILVAGSSWQFFGASATGGPGRDLLVLRYLPDGTLDPAFGAGGVLLHDSGYDNSSAGLALQADQKIVALDYSCPGATCDTTLLRYDAGGSLDPVFGAGGRVGFTGCYPVGVVVQPADQKLVVGCRATGVLNVHYELRRFNTDGSVDTGFGTAGVAGLLARGTGDYLAAIAVAPDGKLLATGDSGQASGVGSTPMVARFTSAGVLDPAFGDAGAFYAASPGPGGVAMAVRPDGRIVLGGTGLLQLTAGGSPDASFGVAGVVELIGPGSGGLVEAIALQPDGKVVFAGKTADWSYQQSDLLLGRQR